MPEAAAPTAAPSPNSAPPVSQDPDDAFWGGPPAAQAAPQPAPQGAAPANPDDAFWGGPAAPLPVKAPPVPRKEKTTGDRAMTLVNGALGQSNKLLNLLEMAGATAPMLADKVHSVVSGMPHTEYQDAYFKHVVEPTQENQQGFELDDQADFTDKLLHGVGGTLMAIDQAIATGGEGAALAAPETMAGRAAVGAATMQAPAAASAVDVGRQVYQATGDAKAASVAGTVSYLTNVASGAVPMGVGGNLATRTLTAAATGAGMGEASRIAQNAAMPDNMQTPFYLQDVAIDALTTAPFGLMGHGKPLVAGMPHQAEERPDSIMERAQLLATEEAKRDGGDDLDATVAATHVNSVLSAHYGAAQFEMHHEEAAASAATQENQLRLETAQEEAARSPAAAFDARDAAQPAQPSPDEAYAARDQAQAAQKNADYTAAQNQVGDQTVAAADAGTEGFEPPTLGDSPVFKTLKERRAAAMAKPTAPTVAERLRDQEPGDNFTPYVAPKDAQATPPQTLAQRRAAAGADGAPTTEPVKAPADRQATAGADEAPSEPVKTLADKRAEAAASDVPAADSNVVDLIPTDTRMETALHNLDLKNQTKALEESAVKFKAIEAQLDSGDRERLAKRIADVSAAKDTDSRAFATQQLRGLLDHFSTLYTPLKDDVVKAAEPPQTLKERRETAGAADDTPATDSAVPRDPKLTGHDTEVQERFAKQIEADPEKAMEDYDAMPDTHGGKVVSADLVKHLSPDYQKDPTGSNEGTQTIASWLANRLYERRMSQTPAPGQDRVMMTGGGTGSGKTTALREAIKNGALDNWHTVYDSTLSGYGSAKRRIELARAAGRPVDVLHTYRDPIEAFRNGMLPRAKVIGRVVPIENHASSHVGARKVIARLANEYENDLAVRVRSIDNRGSEPELIDPRSLPNRGPGILRKQLREVLDHEYQEGRVSPEIYRAASGREPPAIQRPDGGSRGERADDRSEVGSREADRAESESLLRNERTLADRRAEARLPKEGKVPEPTRVVDDETGFKTLAERRAAKIEGRAPRFKDSDTPTAETGSGPRLTKAQAEDYVRPIRESGDNGHIQVHDDAATLPDHIQEAAREGNHPNPRGVYDASTDTTHIVAGEHTSTEDLQRTVAHELAHRDIGHLFGSEYGEAMRDIYANSGKGQKWMADYMERHGRDADNPEHQAEAGNEYAAHLAEHAKENPGVWRRVVDAVRAGLRRLGIVHEWSDNDIRAMLRKAKEARGTEGVARGLHFADADDQSKKMDTAGEALRGKATVEDQTGPDTRSGVKKAKDALAQTWANTLRFRLEGISMHNLKDFLPLAEKRMPAMEEFNRSVSRQAGRKQELLEKKVEIAKHWEAWAKEHPKLAEKQQKLMAASTLAGIDPSKPFENRYTDAEKKADAGKTKHEAMRQNMYSDLRDLYQDLGADGQDIFNKVRDSYAADRKAVLAGLFTRIKAAGLDGNTQRQMMSELRKDFEANQVKGPYFPLARFGDFWAAAKHADGSVASFARFETKAERSQWMAQRRAEGFTGDGQLEGGEKLYHRNTIDKVDPAFVAKVVNMLKGTTKDGGPIDPNGHLQDELWQHYLQSLPEMSMRKQFIHRQGRLGYSADQLRAFTSNGLHSAQQIARLEHGYLLDKHLTDMEDQRRAIEQADPEHTNADRANALAHEYSERYKAIMSPQSSPLASALTKFGSNWYLAFAPGTAIRIGLQNPMIALPTLGGTHGFGPAYRELGRSMGQWIAAKGDLGATLSGDERLAFDEGHKLGVFTNTETRALSNGGNGDAMFTGKRNAIVRASQFLFNGAEHLNRQSTFLAAYRLARQEGKDHEAAVWNAVKQSRDSHFDYSQENRPRLLQGNVARVVGLFKTYSAGVTYRLLREGMDAWKHEDPETQAIARKTFAGLLVHQMAFGGVKGLPMMALVLGAASLALGTDDRPYDATAAAHQWLSENLSPAMADAIMSGPTGVLSGASVSESADYNHLWYHPSDKDLSPKDFVTDLLTQAAGAVANVPVSIATGMQMMAQGHTERGLEHMVPPAAAALMKAIRYGKQGVTTLSGEVILSKDEINGYQLGLQAIGLTPEEIAQTYAWSGARKNLETKILNRHESLQREWVQAIQSGDAEDIKSASEALSKFAQANPGLMRNAGRAMFGALKSSARRYATSVAGINMNPGLRDLDSTYGSAPRPKAAEQ